MMQFFCVGKAMNLCISLLDIIWQLAFRNWNAVKYNIYVYLKISFAERKLKCKHF